MLCYVMRRGGPMVHDRPWQLAISQVGEI